MRMRHLAMWVLCGFLITASGNAAPKKGISPKKLWSLTTGIDAPESAHYCATDGKIYVSNVGGAPTEKDGKGWISVVDLQGKVITAKMGTELNAPKGLHCTQDTLWVTDIDRVVAYDLKTGKKRQEYPVANAKFLNDITTDARGKIYASDTMAEAIFKIDPTAKTNAVTLLVQGKQLAHPNGLAVKDDLLYVASWGEGMADDWSTKTPGGIYTISLTDGTQKRVVGKLGNGDGLEVFKGKAWLYSDWRAGTVFTVKGKKRKQLLSGLKGAADIGYVATKKILLVPEMGANTVHAYQL